VCFSSFLLGGQFVDVARNIDHPYEDVVKFSYRQDVNAKIQISFYHFGYQHVQKSDGFSQI
jgi:hypothetical protein